MVRCKHHYCRCMRANELAQMDMLQEAMQVHNQEVRCRKIEEQDHDQSSSSVHT